MYNFLTMLSILFIVLGVIRIFGIAHGMKDPHQRRMIALAEKLGENPIGEALTKAIILILVCLSWLISRLF